MSVSTFSDMYDEILKGYSVVAIKQLHIKLFSMHAFDSICEEILDILWYLGAGSIHAVQFKHNYDLEFPIHTKIEFDKAMFKLHTLLISTPLEGLPLLINDEDPLTVEIVLWRMKQ